ncbi:hypothetical protein Scep_002616 [Stephania cephalantha]|uniref:Uncharacterized protein n=1 Tax=Stephania cephalantha TaxID=152367 RepID=A0AAP0Q4S9_9MAGN
MDPLAGIRKSAPSVSSDVQIRGKNGSPSRINVGNYHESHQTLFDTSPAISDLNKAFNRNGSLPSNIKANTNQTTSPAGRSPKPENSFASTDDIWVTVSEVPLFTQPTSAPPPSRPPPARSARMSNTTKGSSVANLKKVDKFSRHPMENSWSSKTVPDSSKSSRVSPIEELEDFAMGSSQAKDDEFGHGSFEEELDGNSAATSAAAMKNAMNRAEAKFKYPKEVREKEIAKSARSRVASSQERDEKVMQEVRERELREQQERVDHEQEQREREEKESRDRELEQREREEKEREQRKLEKEKERERQIEREKARQAVERATREARERAAIEARLKAEKAAVEKAIAARQLAERAAVQRAHAEARERAAEGAKQRAERAAAEARERSQAEAREKAAAAAKSEVDERLKAERAASFAGANQQKSENDLESFLIWVLDQTARRGQEHLRTLPLMASFRAGLVLKGHNGLLLELHRA